MYCVCKEHCNEWRQRPAQEIWGVLTGSTRLKETERRYKNCAGLFLVFSCTTALILGCVHSSFFLSLFPLLLFFFWPGKTIEILGGIFVDDIDECGRSS